MLTLSSGLHGTAWDERVGDIFFKLRFTLFGSRPIDPSISIVGLSDGDEEILGLVDGSREPFGRLVDALSEAGAGSIIMDIVFPDRGGMAGDDHFAESAAKAGNVFLPVILRPGVRGGAAGILGHNELSIAFAGMPKDVDRTGDPVIALKLVANYPALQERAAGLGHVNSWPDRDGTFRRMPMVIRLGDTLVPCLALSVACEVLGVDPMRLEVEYGRYIRLPVAVLSDGSIRNIDIPIDKRGMAIVDLPGPWESSFTYYPFKNIVALLDDPDMMEYARTELYGSHLVVADLTTGTSDYGPTVYDGVYPLGGMHAAMLDSILTGSFIRKPHILESMAWVLVLAASVWAASLGSRPVVYILAVSGIWFMAASVQFVSFVSFGIFPSLAAPTAGTVLSIVAVNVYRFLVAEKARTQLRSRVERYFAPALISRIMREQGRLMVAERKVVTVLFSDIAGFTSWCSTRKPDEIHRTLNNYFELMTGIVFRHEGTVDKFIGDGLMAFFGDPVEQPDQALRAVKTAIEMQQALVAARLKPESENTLRMHIRIGVNTGEVIVGDMGSRRIMAYTAIGSNVNLSSRLESKAPVDGILVSEPVFRAVEGFVEARYAGSTTAKGIPEPFETWEVVVPDKS